jgi:hypothetical protein
MKLSTQTSGTKRKIWLGSAAAVLASAATVTVLTTPSQAVTVPPPGESTLLVRDYYEGSPSNIVGQVFITGCNDTPAPPAWGVNSGPSFFKNLPCGPDTDPTSTPPIPPPSF